MNKNYEPVGNNILMVAVSISETIAIPGNVEPNKYTVVATGIDVKHIAQGNEVIISSTAMTTPIQNTNFSLTNADNVLCLVK